MVDLKERLIKHIRATKDPDVLKEIYRLLAIDFDDQDVYELTANQKVAIKEAQQQIKQGQFLTNKQANQEIEEWLKGK